MRNDLQMTMSVLHIDLPVSVCLNVLVKLRELLKSNLLDQQVFKIDDIIIFLGYCVTRYPATRLWAVDIVDCLNASYGCLFTIANLNNILCLKSLRLLLKVDGCLKRPVAICNILVTMSSETGFHNMYQLHSLLLEVLGYPEHLKIFRLQQLPMNNLAVQNCINFDIELETAFVCGLYKTTSDALSTLAAGLQSFFQLICRKLPNISDSGLLSAVRIENYLFPKQNSNKEFKTHLSVAFTDTVTKNLKLLVEAIYSTKPIIVQGISGCGKTTTVRALASITGNHEELIILHLNDQTDSKALLGSYVCTDVPGEFVWQYGILARAVEMGYWVLIEDIDHAPLDFIALISSLLECRTLYVPHKKYPITAHNNFRLFGTRTNNYLTNNLESTWEIPSIKTFSRMWHFVSISAIGSDEVEEILRMSFPHIPQSIGLLLISFISYDDFRTRDGTATWNLRDILKIAARINRYCNRTTNSSSEFITDEVKAKILLDMLDVLCGSNSDGGLYKTYAENIGEKLGIAMSEIDHILTSVTHYTLLNNDASEQKVVKFGRAVLKSTRFVEHAGSSNDEFAPTKYSHQLLDKLAICIEMNEPLLLLGETGCGKTTTVQQLASITDNQLFVQNLSLSTDVSDLLGGYRPVTVKQLLLPTYEKFFTLFQETLSSQKNASFLQSIADLFANHKWEKLLRAFEKGYHSALNKLIQSQTVAIENTTKSRIQHRIKQWNDFYHIVRRNIHGLKKIEGGFAFAFRKGLLMEAMEKGYWILLDEINLATPETLQSLSNFLDPQNEVVSLADHADEEFRVIRRHPNFRIIAAMNPPTDICKKELPNALKNKFTQLYVAELTNFEDLTMIVGKYLHGIVDAPIAEIVNVYNGCRSAANEHLIDGTGHRPRYSLRSLTRSLRASLNFLKIGLRPFRRCLFEAFLINFHTMLQDCSRDFMYDYLKDNLYPDGTKKDLNFPPPRPGGKSSKSDDWILVKPFWIRSGPLPSVDWSEKNQTSGKTVFVATKSVVRNIRTLSAAIASNVAPILIQGPTSIGKTTMIQYLAAKAGYKCVRINNHEHTDVQEYVGAYVTDSTGQLVFQDGLLVEALRQGYWIILDELNLAPSDVLEALNRLLDDNRELLIPETGEIVRPSPGFQLFATQNPPGIYGGRKPLSLAFRNRFIEIDLSDLPSDEVEQIICDTCGIAPKFSHMLVRVMDELHVQRQKSAVLLGKQGLITVRDLIKWGNRLPQNAVDVAKEGYMLVAEKLRSQEEQLVVATILKNVCGVNISPNAIYDEDILCCTALKEAYDRFKCGSLSVEGVSGIAITSSFGRMWTLLYKAFSQNEPVLLIGEAGCGKTMVCQLYAAFVEKELLVLNCHQSTETADLIGGLRPIRGREYMQQQCTENLINFMEELKAQGLTDDILQNQSGDDHDMKKKLDFLQDLLLAKKLELSPLKFVEFETKLSELLSLWRKLRSLFEWENGPLVKAMLEGSVFLMDEINLADDAVIERINSVLEFSREITLAEKGGKNVERLHAHNDFRVVATMNPSGDFGKRELSPALRSRFTEIWIPPLSNKDEIAVIIEEILSIPYCRDSISKAMLHFMEWMNDTVGKYTSTTFSITIREIIAWAKFINHYQPLLIQDIYSSFLHGAFLTILDGLGIGQHSFTREDVKHIKLQALEFLLKQCPPELYTSLKNCVSFLVWPKVAEQFLPKIENGHFSVGNFSISLGNFPPNVDVKYALDSGSTCLNLGRIMRAMQIKRPILLEGPPGVGKTSIITQLARATGHKLIRINLSEHTELSDLLGSDLPVGETLNEQGDNNANFKWCDGVLLKAIKDGSWVLLDELNLAPQTVLEGLNACFDHRAQVFIPEIGQTIDCAPTFRVFCAQNPMIEGGGRKGLPASFLSRFTRVYIEAIDSEMLINIINKVVDLSDFDVVEKTCLVSNLATQIVAFVDYLQADINIGLYGKDGYPWEFNLRDIFRWYEMLLAMIGSTTICNYSDFLTYISKSTVLIFVLRMRNGSDRNRIVQRFVESFGQELTLGSFSETVKYSSNLVKFGSAFLPIREFATMQFDSRSRITPMDDYNVWGNELCVEALAFCVQLSWPALLVGPRKAGKHEAVERLAKLTGNHVRYFSVVPSLDSTELLGTFEQSTINNEIESFCNHVEDFVNKVLSNFISFIGQDVTRDHSLNKDFAGAIELLRVCTLEIKDPQALILNDTEVICKKLETLVESLANLVKKEHFGNASLFEDLRVMIDKFHQLSANLADNGNSKGRFVWVDGIIVNALIEGDWLVMDNINLASASVLDRLNSMLEPNGSLILTEDGSGREIVPHKNFRIFFVMDPAYGEISRAMRNRVLEIYFIPDDFHNKSLFCEHQLAASSYLGCNISDIEEINKRYFGSFDVLSNDQGGSSGMLIPFSSVMRSLDFNFHKLSIELLNGSNLKDALKDIIPPINQLLAISTTEVDIRDFSRGFYIKNCIETAAKLGFLGFTEKALLLLLTMINSHPDVTYQTLWIDRYVLDDKIRLIATAGNVNRYLFAGRKDTINEFLNMIGWKNIQTNRETSKLIILSFIALRSLTDKCNYVDFFETAEDAHTLNTYREYLSAFSHVMDLNDTLSRFLLLSHGRTFYRESIADEASVYSSARGIYCHEIPAESKELIVLGNVFGIITATDKVLKEIICSSKWKNQTPSSLLLDSLSKRDILVNIVLNSSIDELYSSVLWDNILVSVKWIEKVLFRMLQFVKSDEYANDIFEFKSSIIKFYQSMQSIWGKRVSSFKMRLYKETGHLSIPTTRKGWEVLFILRQQLEDIVSKVPIVSYSKSMSVQLLSKENFGLITEWLALYSTFYWSYTNESYGINSSSTKITTISSTDLQLFEEIVKAFNNKIEAIPFKPCLTLSSVEESLHSMDINEQETYILCDPNIACTISNEKNSRILLGFFLLGRSVVYENLVFINEILSKIILTDSLSEINLESVVSVVIETIRIFVWHTSLNVQLLRCLQTLRWCLDYFIKHNGFASSCELKAYGKLFRTILILTDNISYELLANEDKDNNWLRCISYKSLTEEVLLKSNRNIQNVCEEKPSSVCFLPNYSLISLNFTVYAWDPVVFFPSLGLQWVGLSKHSLHYAECNISSLSQVQQSNIVLLCGQLFKRKSALHKQKGISSSCQKIKAHVQRIIIHMADIFQANRDFYVDIFRKLNANCCDEPSCNLVAEKLLVLESMKLPEHICDENVRNLFQKCFNPSLSIINDQTGCFDNRKLGFCLVCIGLLRIHLFLPELPLDPSTKPTHKMNLLQSFVSTIEIELQVEAILNAMRNSNLFNSGMVATFDEMFLLKDKILKYKAHSSERPHISNSTHEDATFQDFYREVAVTLNDLMQIDYIMLMTNQLFDLSYDGASIAVVDNLIAQVANLQSSLNSCIKRFQSAYASFEDFLSVFQSSISNISHGLMLLVNESQNVLKYKKSCNEEVVKRVYGKIFQYPPTANLPSCALMKKRIETSKNQSFSHEDLSVFFDTFPKSTSAKQYTTDKNVNFHSKSLFHLYELMKIDYTTSLGLNSWEQINDTLCNSLYMYVDSYSAVIEAKEKRDKEIGSLYVQKENDVDSLEEIEYRKLFPNHLEGTDLSTEHLEDTSDSGVMNDASNNNDASAPLELFYDENLVKSVIGVHFRYVFLSKNHHNIDMHFSSKVRKVKYVMLKYTTLLLKSCNDGLDSLIFEDLTEEADNLALSITAFSLNSIFPTNNLHTSHSDPKTRELDRDLLFLLNSEYKQPNQSAGEDREFYNPSNFHFDPNPSEIQMAIDPIKNMINRATSLLQMFPGNEILIKLIKFANQLLDYHITTSVGKLLNSIQLLLKYAQEWENIAARHVSILPQLESLCELVRRWREMELRSWDNLLRCQEIVSVKGAFQYWFLLLSMIRNALKFTQPTEIEISQAGSDGSDVNWKQLRFLSPPWLFQTNDFQKNDELSKMSEVKAFEFSFVSQNSDPRFETMSLDECLSRLSNSLDSFLLSSTVGEFPTRLLLVRLMALMLEKQICAMQKFDTHKFTMQRIMKLTLGVWQYYHQFLGGVRSFQELLKIPIQRKLKDEVKLGKWDSYNIFALMESSDRINRKLNKFVQEYKSDVLEYPVRELLKRDLMKGLVDDAGDLVRGTEIPSNSYLFPQVALVDESIDETKENDQNYYQNVFSNHSFEISRFQSEVGLLFDNFPVLKSYQDVISTNFPRIMKLPSLCNRVTSVLKELFDVSAKMDQDSAVTLLHGIRAAQCAEDLCDDIFSRIASLRGEKVARSVKEKAIRDLFETLRDSGFTTLRSKIPGDLKKIASILSCAEFIPKLLAKDLAYSTHICRNLFEKAEYYFSRNLIELPQLRTQSITVHSKDISHRDALQMVSFSENIFLHIVRLRQVFDVSLLNFSELRSHQSYLHNIVDRYSEMADCTSFKMTNCDEQNFLVNMNLFERSKVLHSISASLKVVLIEMIHLLDVIQIAKDGLSHKENLQALVCMETEFKSVGDDVATIDNFCMKLTSWITSIEEWCLVLAGNISSEDIQSYPALENISDGNKTLFCTDNDLLKLHGNLSEFLVQIAQNQNTLSVFIGSNKLNSVIARFKELCGQISNLTIVNTDSGAMKSSIKDDVNSFFEVASNCLDCCLVSIQRLRSFSSDFEKNNFCDSFGDSLTIVAGNSSNLNFCHNITFATESLAIFPVEKLNDLLSRMVAMLLKTESAFVIDMKLRLAILCDMVHLIDKIKNSYQVLIDELLVTHKATNKFLYVVLRIFRTLLAKGICSTEESNNEENEENLQQMQFEDKEGTGMGEGSGQKDVSNEIEDEEQLLGNKNSNKNNSDDITPEKLDKKELTEEEKDTGFDMTNDFDGDMYDVDDKSQSDDELNEEEQPERELGDGNLDDIVDEKQWESGDEDENLDDTNTEKEKFEKDSKTKGDILSDELRTKLGEDSDNEAEDDNNDSPHNGKDNKENEEKDEDFINEDDDNDCTEKQDGAPVKEKQKDNDETGSVEDDAADADSCGQHEDEKDNLDLPDNMNIDDKEDFESSDENDPEGEHLNENMDIDGESEDSDDENELDKPSDSNVGGIENVAENEDDVVPENDTQVPDAANPDLPQTSQSKPTHGVHSMQGQDSILNPPDNVENDQQTENQNNSLGEASAEHGGSQSNNLSQEKSSDLTGNITSKPVEGKSPKETEPSNQMPPNPLLEKGDINKEWFRRLNIAWKDQHMDSSVDQDLSDGQENNENSNESMEQDRGEGTYEYTNDLNRSEQVLGEANTEEKLQIPESGEIPASKDKDDNSLEDLEKPLDRKRKDRDTNENIVRNEPNSEETTQRSKRKKVDTESEVHNENNSSTTQDDEDEDKDESDDSQPMNEADPEISEDQLEYTKNDPLIYTNQQYRFGKTSFSDTIIDGELIDSSDDITRKDYDIAKGQWQYHRASTESHSVRLCEQLRLILEPTLMTRLQGDYRTGKRINMKKIIPYIASGFRKDKIWLRRTKPGKRNYQVMIMIDNSKSMGAAGNLAMSSLALLSNALQRLEIGELCVASFAKQFNVLHPFGKPFNEDAGVNVLSALEFEADQTLLGESLRAAIPVFSTAREGYNADNGNSTTLQLCFIISDARIDSENREKLNGVIRKMSEENILVVLVIIDCNENRRDSIFNTKTVSFVGDKVVTKSYFEDFPFPYYVTIDDVNVLPDILADALKQWFELIRLQLDN